MTLGQGPGRSLPKVVPRRDHRATVPAAKLSKKSLHLIASTQQDQEMEQSTIDEFMRAAITQARKSQSEGGIPIGSSLMRDGRLLAAGHNKRVQENDPVTHAEIDCLRNAGQSAASGTRSRFDAHALLSLRRRGGAVRYQKSDSRRITDIPWRPDFMRSHGVEVIDLNLPECVEMMRKFIAEHLELWNEDIGRGA